MPEEETIAWIPRWAKKGEVLEVLDRGGVEHYHVRWDDGHEGLFYPGSDAHSLHPGQRGGPAQR